MGHGMGTSPEGSLAEGTGIGGFMGQVGNPRKVPEQGVSRRRPPAAEKEPPTASELFFFVLEQSQEWRAWRSCVPLVGAVAPPVGSPPVEPRFISGAGLSQEHLRRRPDLHTSRGGS